MTSTTTVPDDHATKHRVLRAVTVAACLPLLAGTGSAAPAATTAVTYAVQVIIGLLVLAAGTRFFVQRPAPAAAL
ncbi:hypothetical protein V7793_23895 [Streptomyces sp. KLMMK]|uniref:hypothetical protein n=1 Tax=Streptomyces sp. KLMMK TaxID=3109353 RepID=UPI0030088448